jgi:3-deoxy-D-manno-octulosonic-acid transferase
LRAALPLVRAVAPLNAKLKRGVAGRATALADLRKWARRAVRAPLIWVHAPSVGESLMAQAIIREATFAQPKRRSIHAFSPSAERVRERVARHLDLFAVGHIGKPAQRSRSSSTFRDCVRAQRDLAQPRSPGD